MSDFQLKRLGLIMEPEPGNLHEVEGTLNPAAMRGPDGQLYLFPRLVAKGNYSRIGIAMRATSNNETTALLMGINVKHISAISWLLSSTFAAFAGLSFCLMFSLEPEISQMGLRGFPASILGGLDSVVGGAFGGLVIGVAENMAGGYLGRGLKEIAGFVLIVLVLMVKPYGLFGQREIERV